MRHARGYVTVYAHNDQHHAAEGARVRRGQLIASVGRTGRTTGPNLHFEVRKDNVAYDPLLFLPLARPPARATSSSTRPAPAKEAERMDLRRYIRDIPDFPKPGIVFKDITPLLADGPALRWTIDHLSERYRGTVDMVLGIESRGFIFGAALAYALGVGIAIVRKPGKLPAQTRSRRSTSSSTATTRSRSTATPSASRRAC